LTARLYIHFQHDGKQYQTKMLLATVKSLTFINGKQRYKRREKLMEALL